MSTDRTSTRIVLASRPTGEPTLENFRTETVELPPLEPGQVLVRNSAVSVDPYMRGRMNDVKSYIPPFGIDEPLTGHAVGEVIESRSEDVPVGAHVTHFLGWRDLAVVDAADATVVDTGSVPDAAYLGVLGMPGLTAWGGLTRTGGLQEGDVVFVSGAAGAVGSMVGQLAKLLGASRVIGSAGGPEKAAHLKELGFDAAIDYRAGDLPGQLAEAAPDGIDLYFDNVGGDHLEAALGALNVHGRVAMCGAISQYNATEPPTAPRNLALVIGKRLRLQGLLAADFAAEKDAFIEQVAPFVADGSLQWQVTERHGIEDAPQAFIDLLRGANTGKMIVRP
ncbi:NADP-dependent oxidoreductase [Kytococcus sp. Marseille-QA3725]